MEEYDAFSAGVEFGGLRNRHEIKLLICFLLENLDRSLSKAQLNEVMQEQGLANYFDVNQALGELIDNGTVGMELFEEQEILSLTGIGRDATQLLENDLPKTVREKALNAAVKLQTKARRARENKIELEKLEIGYNVTFTISDKDDILMRLTVYVADITQVETVKQGFLNDPVSLYSGIIAALTA
ncbi:MAG: DUF4364 family protein [Eubacteriales bacterium]